ncbi:hypothetical protein F2Q69_00058261 [Brassica cretica]|uniref:HECT domain-containing protein n=1 Tax=Brassica cretica TaxID=69181 RepID=A0A8S9RPZ8_BRACR|nr:hypothetical protein F2Q69_00058261 [Brassica cretica]
MVSFRGEFGVDLGGLTREEYINLIAKINVLFYSTLTMLMIFFNGKRKYLHEMKKKAIVIVACVFAMVYLGFAFINVHKGYCTSRARQSRIKSHILSNPKI